MFDLEKYWWECPECCSMFRYEEEAHRCQQMDMWPEDCLEWMHRGLVEIPDTIFTYKPEEKGS